jgi:hypothetical protein
MGESRGSKDTEVCSRNENRHDTILHCGMVPADSALLIGYSFLTQPLFRRHEYRFKQRHGRRERVRAPVKMQFLGLQQGADRQKNLYTKSERLIVSCTVTWARSERVNLYSRQIMILPRKTTYAT